MALAVGKFGVGGQASGATQALILGERNMADGGAGWEVEETIGIARVTVDLLSVVVMRLEATAERALD
jgi:hypothetical protein